VQFKDKNVSNTKKKDITEKSEGLVEGIKTYLKGVRSEWGKITWPERNQIFYETLVVLGVVIIFTVIVLVLDLVFKNFVFSLLK